MPSLLSSVVEIINAAGQRVDQIVRGHRQPIALRFGAGLVPSSSDRGDNITEVLVVTDTAGGGTHAVATPSVAGFESAADKTALNALSYSYLRPDTVVEAGADGTVVITSFLPASVTFKSAADAGTHDHLFDVGGSTVPPGSSVNLLIDFTIHGFRDSAGKAGIGCWKKSATWKNTAGLGYLSLIGESALVDIDASLHDYRPTVAAGTDSGDPYMAKLSLAAPNGTDTFYWIITAEAQSTRYPGLA